MRSRTTCRCSQASGQTDWQLEERQAAAPSLSVNDRRPTQCWPPFSGSKASFLFEALLEDSPDLRFSTRGLHRESQGCQEQAEGLLGCTQSFCKSGVMIVNVDK